MLRGTHFASQDYKLSANWTPLAGSAFRLPLRGAHEPPGQCPGGFVFWKLGSFTLSLMKKLMTND
jgi:hypothetical protein